jgi:hypothetical protein
MLCAHIYDTVVVWNTYYTACTPRKCDVGWQVDETACLLVSCGLQYLHCFQMSRYLRQC